MDLNRYWVVVRDQWFFFVLGIVLTATLAGVFVSRQPDVYESTGTFVVRPRVIEGQEVVRAIDALNRSVEIGSTYAYIARSDLIEQRAKATAEGDFGGFSVAADLVPGTNVIEVSVTGGDPVAVGNLAVAVGVETVNYIGNLEDAFELVALDSAEVPTAPIGPNRGLTLGFGVIFGIVVGALLALLAHIIKEWRQRPSRTDITDVYTGVYSEQYFHARFRQEVLRAKRRRNNFSLGLMRIVVDHVSHESAPSQSVLRQVAMAFQGKLSDDDVLAYLGDGVFGVILLGYDYARAEWQLKQWQKELETIEFIDSGFALNIRISVGVGTYGVSTPVPEAADELVSTLL